MHLIQVSLKYFWFYPSFLEHESIKNAHSYKLYGISKHSGNLNGGHYVGDVRDVDE
jgi:ubiquitin C-terminal hydrolase